MILVKDFLILGDCLCLPQGWTTGSLRGQIKVTFHPKPTILPIGLEASDATSILTTRS